MIALEGVSKSFKKNEPVLDDIHFTVQDGEIVAILGPSGCGKTTILRMIAGLEKQSDGVVRIGNQAITKDHGWVPAHKRSIGMVFQDYALFPHLTVAENICFGVKEPKATKKQLVQSLLDLVNLVGFDHRYPHQLSGGQQQRVALARALAPSPQVLLMDEPFSNLDSERKHIMRSEIKHILKKAGITTILVTHDIKDALAIADQMIVMNKGKIEQVGAPYDVYQHPQSAFVARFVSRSNVIPVEKRDGVYHCAFGPLSDPDSSAPSQGELVIRRDHIQLTPTGKYQGVVKEVVFEGEYIEVDLTTHDETITCMLPPTTTQSFAIGETVRFDLLNYTIIQPKKYAVSI